MKLLEFYYEKAKKEKRAIGQFNFSTFEVLRAAIKAAKKTKSPIILGTSQKEADFFGMKEAYALKEILSLKYNVPVFLNLDHGRDIKVIKEAIGIGYDCVHFDGSNLKYEENIKKTREVVLYAKKRGVMIEGEIDTIADSPGQETNLASVDLICKFIKETGVSLLAVGIGSVHGIYKDMPNLDFKRLLEIKNNTDINLVLHGASGIEENEIKKAVEGGIVKVNINTEIRKKWKESFINFLSGTEIKPYDIVPKVEDEIERAIIEKIKILWGK